MKLVDQFDQFIFDLDGCLYIEDQVIPAAPGTIAELRGRGKKVLFLTNDSTRMRQQYAAKLTRMGIDARVEDVVSGGWATANYIVRHHQGEPLDAYVIGNDNLKAEMEAAGLRLLGEAEVSRARIVVVGVHQEFNFKEMTLATRAVHRGAHFYSTNRDSNMITPEGLRPGTGALVVAIEYASGREATAVGKPGTALFEVARSILGPGRAIMIGDRIDSDIVGGKRAGLATALVLTGSTTRGDLETASCQPDYVLEDVGGLIHTDI